MPRSIEVEVDAAGNVHALDGGTLPEGRARFTWLSPEDWGALKLSEVSLAKNWLTPEEDEAWAHLQPDR